MFQMAHNANLKHVSDRHIFRTACCTNSKLYSTSRMDVFHFMNGCDLHGVHVRQLGLFVVTLIFQQGWHSCASEHHRPFIFFSGRTSFNLSLPLRVHLDTHMYSQWSKNIPWKIINNVPFCPPNYQNIELHVLT